MKKILRRKKITKVIVEEVCILILNSSANAPFHSSSCQLSYCSRLAWPTVVKRKKFIETTTKIIQSSFKILILSIFIHTSIITFIC